MRGTVAKKLRKQAKTDFGDEWKKPYKEAKKLFKDSKGK